MEVTHNVIELNDLHELLFGVCNLIPGPVISHVLVIHGHLSGYAFLCLDLLIRG